MGSTSSGARAIARSKLKESRPESTIRYSLSVAAHQERHQVLGRLRISARDTVLQVGR